MGTRALSQKFSLIWPHLNERARRMMAASEARQLGHGDPESPLRWTSKSTRALATELTTQSHPISHEKVAQLLRDMGYSLQSNRKTEEGNDHPDRDAQFRHINEEVRAALARGQPVVSVDTKKKELGAALPRRR